MFKNLIFLTSLINFLYSPLAIGNPKDLPPCPEDTKAEYHNCIGSRSGEVQGLKWKYVGQYMNNKRNGKGTYSLSNGIKWEGEFKDGMLTGQGTEYYPDGSIKYKGEFVDNKFHGQGTYRDNNLKYVGQFYEAKLKGHGTLTYSDGKKHEGQFNNNQAHGWGIVTYTDGNKLVGQWKFGWEDGLVVFFSTDGSREIGHYVKGQIKEHAIKILLDGSIAYPYYEYGEVIGNLEVDGKHPINAFDSTPFVGDWIKDYGFDDADYLIDSCENPDFIIRRDFVWNNTLSQLYPMAVVQENANTLKNPINDFVINRLYIEKNGKILSVTTPADSDKKKEDVPSVFKEYFIKCSKTVDFKNFNFEFKMDASLDEAMDEAMKNSQ